MGRAGPADRSGVLIADGPADVVVAADVGDPGGGAGLGREAAQCLRGEAGVAGGEHGPDLHHQGVVVGDFADLAVVRPAAEILDQLVRRDDRLGLEDHCRASDPGDGVQRLGDRVHLGLVLAVGPQSLPEERDGVQPQYLDADVCQEEHDVGVLGEDVGVGPVHVPLPGIEGGPHPAVQVVVEREAAGSEIGEHLGQRLLEPVGLDPVRVDPEVPAVVRIAGPRRHRPGVLPGNVIEHEIDNQADLRFSQPAGEGP